MKYMGTFRQRRRDRQVARSQRQRTFGWLADNQDLIVTVTLVIVYRLIHVISVVGFGPKDFLAFWCESHDFSVPLHPGFMLVFGLLLVWMLSVIVARLWQGPAGRWPMLTVRGLTVALLVGYMYVLHEQYGGLRCSVRSPAYFAAELHQERYEEFKRFLASLREDEDE